MYMFVYIIVFMYMYCNVYAYVHVYVYQHFYAYAVFIHMLCLYICCDYTYAVIIHMLCSYICCVYTYAVFIHMLCLYIYAVLRCIQFPPGNCCMQLYQGPLCCNYIWTLFQNFRPQNREFSDIVACDFMRCNTVHVHVLVHMESDA